MKDSNMQQSDKHRARGLIDSKLVLDYSDWQQNSSLNYISKAIKTSRRQNQIRKLSVFEGFSGIPID